MTARIDEFAREVRSVFPLRGKPLTGRYHISLVPLDLRLGSPEAVRQAASEVAVEVAAFTPPFEVRLERIASFGARKPRPLVLLNRKENAALMNLYRGLGRGLKNRDPSYCWDRNITPHGTVLYDQRDIKEQSVAPMSWRVTEFVLTQSFVGESRHETRGCWLLQG